MASDQHKRLAAFIKATHNQLRRESRIYGPREAWERHLARTELLQNYATTMRELATSHWNADIRENDEGTHCRIKWIRSQCYDYFFNGGERKFDHREIDIERKILNSENRLDSVDRSISKEITNIGRFSNSQSKIKLLDVGSCYNPLESEKMFDVIPIDLAPSDDKVFRCDFLKVPLGKETVFSSDGRSVEILKESSFDAVVFSLLLEYLPCPEQRFACCEKAYRCLRSGGILVIVTPDSNHVGANANIMKSWRLILSRLGFMRIKYEKLPHLHCLEFRKCSDRAVSARWAEMQIIPEIDRHLSLENKMYIPQDFSSTPVLEESREKIVYDAEELASVFSDMPCFDDTSE